MKKPNIYILASVLCITASTFTSFTQPAAAQAASHSSGSSAGSASESEMIQVDEELMDNFFIDADIEIPRHQYQTYQTTLKEFDKEKLLALLMPDAKESELQTETFDTGSSISWQSEYLSFGSGVFRYSKDEEIKYIQSLMDMAESNGLLEDKELDFMTSQEAAGMAEDFIQKLELGVAPCILGTGACTKEDLLSIQDYCLTYDEHFRGMAELGKFTKKDVFANEDETYMIKFGFTMDDLPVLGPEDPDLHTIEGVNAPPPAQPMEGVFYISSSGFRCIQLFSAVGPITEASEGQPILLLDGIKAALTKKYGDVILMEKIKITHIWLEYLPLKNAADYRQIELVPAWCCVYYPDSSDTFDDNYDLRQADRFHAVTGEMIA